ncbi:MAG: hypothetical protein H0V76_11200 [Blastocatellia bacterium]|nr:hypothetical protein [Blastocatellia bacterium]
MDVYHKVLAKLYDEAGGKDSARVDLTDILKREGFLPSIDSISGYLIGESWVTETDRKHVVKLTHWGIAEAKRTIAGAPDKNQIVQKESNRLLASLREVQIMTEEFAVTPAADKLERIEGAASEIVTIIGRIKSNM